jgi:hypothetical protein
MDLPIVEQARASERARIADYLTRQTTKVSPIIAGLLHDLARRIKLATDEGGLDEPGAAPLHSPMFKEPHSPPAPAAREPLPPQHDASQYYQPQTRSTQHTGAPVPPPSCPGCGRQDTISPAHGGKFICGPCATTFDARPVGYRPDQLRGTAQPSYGPTGEVMPEDAPSKG